MKATTLACGRGLSKKLDLMEQLLTVVAIQVALVLDAVAILMVVIGAIETVIAIPRAILRHTYGNADKRAVWLEFADWLVAALTFQLGADIVKTAITPDWDDVGRVAVVAAIRTVLAFFLNRDIDEIREYHKTRRKNHTGKDA